MTLLKAYTFLFFERDIERKYAFLLFLVARKYERDRYCI